MRVMSVEGAPFKRGCIETAVFKFIKGIIYTKATIEFNKSHQDVDSRDARITRDIKDVQTLQQSSQEHNPFQDIDRFT